MPCKARVAIKRQSLWGKRIGPNWANEISGPTKATLLPGRT